MRSLFVVIIQVIGLYMLLWQLVSIVTWLPGLASQVGASGWRGVEHLVFPVYVPWIVAVALAVFLIRGAGWVAGRLRLQAAGDLIISLDQRSLLSVGIRLVGIYWLLMRISNWATMVSTNFSSGQPLHSIFTLQLVMNLVVHLSVIAALLLTANSIAERLMRWEEPAPTPPPTGSV